MFRGHKSMETSAGQNPAACGSDAKNRGGVMKMSKAVKKKSRRLWRTVRKTLGTLFLVSALVIAAIPVDYLRATDVSPTATTGSVTPTVAIPQGTADTVIYTTADTRMNFIYVREIAGDTSSPYACVIVRFRKGQTDGGSYSIPNEVDAYRQYTPSEGQGGGFAAVGMKDNFLFYRNTRSNSYPTLAEMEAAQIRKTEF